MAKGDMMGKGYTIFTELINAGAQRYRAVQCLPPWLPMLVAHAVRPTRKSCVVGQERVCLHGVLRHCRQP